MRFEYTWLHLPINTKYIYRIRPNFRGAQFSRIATIRENRENYAPQKFGGIRYAEELNQLVNGRALSLIRDEQNCYCCRFSTEKVLLRGGFTAAILHVSNVLRRCCEQTV